VRLLGMLFGTTADVRSWGAKRTSLKDRRPKSACNQPAIGLATDPGSEPVLDLDPVPESATAIVALAVL
jgi:hypothetical protein